MQKHLLSEEHLMFQEAVRAFAQQEVVPHHAAWEKQGHVSRELWQKAGAQGMLCMDFPEEYGGLGLQDFRYNAIVGEEMAYVNASGPGFILHNDVVAPYAIEYFTDEQKARWMPGMISGDIISAIAMTEPGTGSDLAAVKTTAIKKGDRYIVNGSKTFITNGILSNFVFVVAKTDPTQQHGGISLIVLEEGMKGFTRGKNLEKIGMKAQDTAELFFEDVEVPEENLLGKEGQGFFYLEVV